MQKQKKLTPVISRGFSIPKGIVPKELLELSVEEKERLKALLSDPVFIRAIEYAELSKPPSAIDPAVTTEQKAERLAQILGWDQCVAALHLQAQTEVYDFPKHQDVPYTWTDDKLDNDNDND